MRTKLIALAGAILLLAACETDSDEAADAGGTGDASMPAPVVEAAPELQPVHPADHFVHGAEAEPGHVLAQALREHREVGSHRFRGA
ncbi:MAG: hypothetical protein QF726_04365, partial [Alphaproteobacteria bacterium]|nr:hypothetical protein [Alphaproteobacteria bacterium]